MKGNGNKSGAGFSRSRSGGRFGAAFGVLFGMIFAGAGCFFMWMGGLQLVFDAMASKGWPQATCVIVSSEVGAHSSSDGTTYSVDISFRYQFEGSYYTGGSYNVSDWNSSGRKGKEEVVGRYPVGSETTCYVNPDDPEIAVLSQRIPTVVYFIIPFSSIFILIGLGVMAGSAGLLPQSWSIGKSRHKRVSMASEGRAELKPRHSPATKLFGVTLAAVFWNGITGVFVWQVIAGLREGNPEWFLTLFMIPFVLVGLGLICAVVYHGLALSNPKPALRLSEGMPRLGEATRLTWEFTGAVQRLSALKITLQGIESATYRRGTNSVTDTSTFYTATLFETDTAANFRNGEAGLAVPANLMHSFDGGNNKIEWIIKVQGDILRWPDVKDEFPITVRPHQPASA